MNEKPSKLPELKVLKELVKEVGNIVWYSRQPSFEGPEESIKFIKEEIKKFKKNKE